MCGIAGIIDYSTKVDLAPTIDSMVRRIEHRGPDGRGTLVRRRVALGHARLSIIDFEGGAQPMTSVDDRVHLTFNGEIYNYRDLRVQLQRFGHDFKSQSDTEVVLAAYRQWGKRCVERFEGMFAFAIADFDKNEMFLARDPFGIKPLLYRVANNSFAFASEFQAFWGMDDWAGEIDLFSIDLYLRYQYIPAPRTAFRGVFKLPAGHRMTVRIGEPHQKIERYWEPDFKQKKKRSPEQIVDQLDDALRDSVRRHLVSDVPFGALLSGGIDSSLVVGYMSELLDSPVKTFSIGFEDESVDELKYARIVAQAYGTDHHEEIVRLNALEMLPEIVRHYGEPFGDQSAIPTWHACKLARSEVPMVLSGDGGDELLAGYRTYGRWLNRSHHNERTPEKFWKRLARSVLRRPSPCDGALRENNMAHWMSFVGRYNDQSRELLWKPELRFLADQSCQQFRDAFAAGNCLAHLNVAQRVDLETFLPEDILFKVDIASMRCGIEVRPPMLDREFFSFVSTIPSEGLYEFGKDNKYAGKKPLRTLAARKLGKAFADRPKQGFLLPLESWLRKNPKSSQEIRNRLVATDSHIANWFSVDAIHSVIDQGHVVRVWQLLVLDEWLGQVRVHSKNSRISSETVPSST
ncbi:Asparagine synthetase [glutamine-hydrolyzing] 1 [Rosistilla carotiformis]|uniref:asparagine synthase (glutamine-hydrolyzing) n=1 Tax=Rosistilla carotiformis TaxID=2528017 RepID=A0A518JVH0_9BACT|nr:asparagine synthase (glutamine-hydrolyzing) [Rosistilla carotiformis]QDV69543.1 Asparagine synthetase [glutamine-hydrolyzing] 1 [Rosistilla carotiformis]